MWRSQFELKNFPSIFASIVIIGGVFFVGFEVGKGRGASETQDIPITLGNLELGKKTNADFADFWKVWNTLNDKFVGSTTTPDEQEKVYGAIEGLTASYGDSYTVFFPPEESKQFAEQISGAFEGVGMEIGIREGVLVVVSPINGTPAFNAGVHAGDKILKIDDTNAVYLPVEKAIKLIRGPKGTEVKITFAREGEKNPVVLSIIRDTINVPTVITEARKDGIFVIHLYSFNAQAMSLFRNALREFVTSGDDKLILDLRNNPGGYLEAAVDMTSFWLPPGAVVVKENYGGKKEELIHRSYGYNIFTDKLKFVILINKGSASASEILAGALQAHKKATLIGDTTFGKGSVQELVEIGKASLKVTVAKWLTPNNVSISDGGLTPDILIPLTPEEQEKKGDLQMEGAVSYLLGK